MNLAAGLIPSATARTEIADYLSTVIYVYTLLIVLYIIVQLILAFAHRPAYSLRSNAILKFLRDVCEPYLRVFRRVIPPIGGIDFSPILAIFTLELFNSIVVNRLIHGS
jgi:YggT family protein